MDQEVHMNALIKLFSLMVIVVALAACVADGPISTQEPVVADVTCLIQYHVQVSYRGQKEPYRDLISSVGIQAKNTTLEWRIAGFDEFQEKLVSFFEREVAKENVNFLNQISWRGSAFSLLNAKDVHGYYPRVFYDPNVRTETWSYGACPESGYFAKTYIVYPGALVSPSGFATLTQTTMVGDEVWFEAATKRSSVKFSVPMKNLRDEAAFAYPLSFDAANTYMNQYVDRRASLLSAWQREVAVFSIDSNDEGAGDLYALLRNITAYYPDVIVVDTANFNGKSVVHVGSLITR
jgi:hypothetical protein